MAFTYHIIEFKELPYTGVQGHVCVPNSWLRWKDTSSKDAIIAYPDCGTGVDEMVQNNAEYLESWKLYKVVRKHATDSYESAMRILETMKSVKKEDGAMEDELKNVYEQLARLQLRIEQLEEKEDAKNDSNSTDDDDIFVTAQANQSALILPPEYDPANSKWTLKHREFKDGLVELKPRAKDKVYIDGEALERCKRSAKDCKELARLLLVEVFTENALKVCSWTGKKGRTSNAGDVRPGLDKNAREQLVKCVLRVGREKGWRVDKDKVEKTLKGKLQRIHEK